MDPDQSRAQMVHRGVNKCEGDPRVVLAMDRDLDFVTADGMPNKSRQNVLDHNDRWTGGDCST